MSNLQFQKYRYSGLKWIRRRKNGVSEWRGTWRNGPPLWFCRMFLTMSVLFGIAGVAFVIGQLMGAQEFSPAVTFVFISAIYSGVAFFSYRQRAQFTRLVEPEQLASEMGISSEELERLAEERDIKPDLYFNDVPLYNPDKLIAAKVLLRASEQPVETDTLLRAATPTASPSETDQLLRASQTE